MLVNPAAYGDLDSSTCYGCHRAVCLSASWPLVRLHGFRSETLIQECISCFVFVEKKKEPRIPTVSEMKIFCQVFLEQICRGGCGTAIGEYWGLQQSEIPRYIYLHPSVFSNSPESATFPTHQQSTLDDDSKCVETLS